MSSDPSGSLHARIDRVQSLALVAGAGGLVACLGIGWLWPARFFPAYLVAYLFWLGFGLGSLGILMLHYLVGGSWGRLIRRPLEAAAGTIVPLAFLFTPLILGMRYLYRWTDPEVVAHSEALRHKAPYLNTNAFLIRAAAIFLIWTVIGWLLNRWSDRRLATGDFRFKKRLQKLSGPGLVVYVLTCTFASIDWVMSIEPEWYSTIYGAMILVGQGLATFAFSILVAVALAGDTDEPPPVMGHHEESPASWFHDLGNLLLAFVMLWAYIAFSQFLIVWNGNLAEEIPWYLRRTQGGWQVVALVLVIFHFFLPFLVLLLRPVKRRARRLLWVAGLVLVMHLVDLTWLVVPAFPPGTQPAIDWGKLAIIPVALVGVGGFWLASFAWLLKRKPLDLLAEAAGELEPRAGGHAHA